MTRLFHVTSTKNRTSIQAHGLNWKRMKDAPGIAGSQRAEQEGVFLCEDESEADWFVRMNNTGGPVDVWAVEAIDKEELIEAPEGHLYLARPIPPDRLTLVRCDIEPGAG